jgi:hypothetical protein
MRALTTPGPSLLLWAQSVRPLHQIALSPCLHADPSPARRPLSTAPRAAGRPPARAPCTDRCHAWRPSPRRRAAGAAPRPAAARARARACAPPAPALETVFFCFITRAFPPRPRPACAPLHLCNGASHSLHGARTGPVPFQAGYNRLCWGSGGDAMVAAGGWGEGSFSLAGGCKRQARKGGGAGRGSLGERFRGKRLRSGDRQEREGCQKGEGRGCNAPGRGRGQPCACACACA